MGFFKVLKIQLLKGRPHSATAQKIVVYILDQLFNVFQAMMR